VQDLPPYLVTALGAQNLLCSGT